MATVDISTAAAELACELPDLVAAADEAADLTHLLLERDWSNPLDVDHRAQIEDTCAELRAALARASAALELLDPPTTAEFEIATPPSMNTNEARSIRGFARIKRDLQQRMVVALTDLDLPRPIPGYLHVEARVTRPTRRGRDDDNYHWPISKALGDALSKPDYTINGARYPCRWIADDTRRYWKLNVEVAEEPGPDALHITLSWRTRT